MVALFEEEEHCDRQACAAAHEVVDMVKERNLHSREVQLVQLVAMAEASCMAAAVVGLEDDLGQISQQWSRLVARGGAVAAVNAQDRWHLSS